MFIYFLAFNILEASLPSLVSKQADVNSKGTAMGIYSSSQFLGIFAGGALAGVLYQWVGEKGIFLANGLLALLWLLISFSMQPNAYLSTLIVNYPANPKGGEDELMQQLKKLPGIKEIMPAPEEKILYCRLDKAIYQGGSIEKVLQQFS